MVGSIPVCNEVISEDHEFMWYRDKDSINCATIVINVIRQISQFIGVVKKSSRQILFTKNK